MGGTLSSWSILSRSDNKHGRHGQFLILIGWVFKNLLLWKPIGQMKPNFEESIYWRSCIKFVHCVPIRQEPWPPCAILHSDWLSFQKSSPLKLLGQMAPNFATNIYWRAFKVVHFVTIRLQTWLPWEILNSDWLSFQNIFSSETAWQNGTKLYRKHL